MNNVGSNRSRLERLEGWLVLAAAILLSVCWRDVTAQTTGYRLSGSQVLVDTRSHWQSWEFPVGTVQVSADGVVRPRRMHKGTNAAAGIVDLLRLDPPEALKDRDPATFALRDAVAAGSNLADVVDVFDADPATYWEPEAPSEQVDLAAQWWFSVDLGEVAFVRKMVIRFVDEELGDPFLLFDILLSDGRPPRGSSNKELLRFKPVLQTLVPNKTQRVFEIDFASVPEVGGELARFVKVVVTGSDLDRGRQISREGFDALDSANRGAIEFYKLQPDGTQILVDASVYDQLESARQGDVLYYRRELPRLAELEIWKEGDNVMRGTLDRGGSVSSSANNVSGSVLLDGSIDSFSFFVFSEPNLDLSFDLGAHFWIDTHRVIFNTFSPAATSSFPSYQLDVSDGGLAADGTLRWQSVVDRPQLPVGGVSVEGNDFEPVKARFFRTRWLEAGAESNLAEVQLFGQGYQPQVQLESDLIRLGGSRNLLTVEWEGLTPPGTQLLVQTRTGNQLEDIFLYYDKDGNEVTRQFYYEKLKSFTRGDSIPAQIPGSDWSGWSAPYGDPDSSPITSPSPREFLKIRATLLSDDPDTSAALATIRLRFGDPVAQQLIGEIEPWRIDSLGVEQSFSLYLRPQFSPSDRGFDQFLLVAPADMALIFEGLYAGDETDLVNLAGVTQMDTGSDSLQLSFPAIDPRSDVDILRVDFRTTLFSSGSALMPSFQSSQLGRDIWQRVDAGNVVDLVDGNTITLVSNSADNRILANASVVPPILTPNGDGLNETAAFVFQVLRVDDDSPVEATIFDLGGRQRAHLVERRSRSAGAYEITWDGTDTAGGLVAPGLYVVRLRVDAETEGADVRDVETLLTVGVAY
jgi:hypothetical protein